VTQLLVLEGDGIGPEICAATLAVLQVADRRFALGLAFTQATIGFAALRQHGTTCPDAAIEAAKAADKLGLRVAAGHGLDYWNVRPIAAIEEITELNIGYAIVCRAVLTGMERAVRDMKDLIG